MIRQFEPERALEVVDPKHGSAYRIGGRLVLTAAHLLDEVEYICRVRSKRTFGTAEAVVVWKAADADIALIELPESIAPCKSVTFGRLPKPISGEKIAFQMYGYPGWGMTQRMGRPASGGRQVEGVIYLADTSADNLLVIEASRLPDSSPNSESGWKGMSGAAIVCDGLVVAVQIQHQNPQRSASLEAYPLSRIQNNERWKTLLQKHSINSNFQTVRISNQELFTSLQSYGKEVINYGEIHQALRGIPATSSFFGREKEIETLKEWITCRKHKIVAILGIGGIGKTKLAAKLAAVTENEFEYVLWRRLSSPLPLAEIVADFIKLFSNQQDTILEETLDLKLSRLLFYLTSHRCLIIIDNIESILEGSSIAGKYIAEYEEYGQFFRTIGGFEHNSCLLLTSREKPKEISRLEGRNRPVRSYELDGVDYLTCKKIFSEIAPFQASDAAWKGLTQAYSGNPLSLELAAKLIEEVYFGNIQEFLKSGRLAFNDIEYLLEWHFERLSSREKEIVYWLSINREPVLFSEIERDILSPSNKEDLQSTFQSLQRRFLLNKSNISEGVFTLQPVIIEYFTQKFIHETSQEILHQRPNLFNAHSLIKASSDDYIREAQIRFILIPFYEKIKIDADFKIKLKSILQRLRAEHTSGYAAGNILNLLCYISADLKDFDFSNLEILQANLSGSNLRYANLAYASLSKCSFTQTSGRIISIAVSSSGRFIAAGDIFGEIYIWQINEDKLLMTCKGHTSLVWSVAFSSDENKLISGSEDLTIKMWDIWTGQCIRTMRGHTDKISSVALNTDESIVASGSEDNTVKLWDIESGECIRTLRGHSDRVRSISFSSDSKFLASAGADKIIKLWNTEAGTIVGDFEGHTESISTVSFSPNEQLIASGSSDKTVRIWDVNTFKQLNILKGHDGIVTSVSFNLDGRKLVSSSYDQQVKLWEVQTGLCIQTMLGHEDWVWSAAFSPNEQVIISGSSDQKIKFWDVKTGLCLKSIEGYSNAVKSIAFTPDSEILITGNYDRTITFWSLREFECFRILKGHPKSILSIALSPDGKVLATSSYDSTVRLWDVETVMNDQHFEQQRNSRELKGHTGNTPSVAFSPSGRFVASSNFDRTIRLWDTSTISGQCTQVFKGHTHWVWCASFSPDGQFIASGSEDNTVKIWNKTTGFCANTFQGHTNSVLSVAFNPQGKTLASSSEDATVKLWDIFTGECITTFCGHTSPVGTVAFSPNGKILASGGFDQQIRIWRIQTGEIIKVLQNKDGIVRTVAFSPDKKFLASGHGNGIIIIWSLNSFKMIRKMRVPRPYEGTIITGINGLTEAQKYTLKFLGAVEK